MQSLADLKKLFYPIACSFVGSNNILTILHSELLFVQGSPVGSRSQRIIGLELNL